MGIQAPQSKSTLTIKTMIKMFGPIVLFSIVLPLVDILTDLRLISKLYFGKYRCRYTNITDNERRDCFTSDDLPTFCRLNPTVCRTSRPTLLQSQAQKN